MNSATPIFEGKECLGCGYELAGSTSDHCPECGRLNQPLTLLATYRERQWGLRREFFLYDDRIIVRRRQWMGNEMEVPIRLATLQPDFGVLRTRSKAFKAAASFSATCAVAAVINLVQIATRPLSRSRCSRFLGAYQQSVWLWRY